MLMWQGYDRARGWRVRKSGGYLTALVLTFLGALLLLFLAVTAVVTLAHGKGFKSPIKWVDVQCAKSAFGCSVLQSLFMPFLTLALATLAYLFFRFRHVCGTYLRRAREAPHELVETAGGIFGRVVGRDQLCSVLMEDLRDRRFRRTHIVVGGVGTGKTALLVLLTQRLAERGAVPVPVPLRAGEGDLDFRALAFGHFCRQVQGSIRSGAEAEKVWRRLCQQGRIVILADGLEEALAAEEPAEERDTIIRLAIRRANDENLPLIITSRPHDTLRGMEASLTELEPLSEEAALRYISSGGAGEDWQRLDWIVERAGIAEAPTYLQIAAELHDAGLLERALTGPSKEEAVETRGGDRAGLRLHLLETWISGLINGRFQPELPLAPEERRATIDYLSALACVGLRLDSSEVPFADVINEQSPARSRFQEIFWELDRRVRDSRIDIRLAAHWGRRMGLVELSGNHVRFQHSVIQAHLGTRFLNAVIYPGVPAESAESSYFPAALERPGRELLIAMVLYSRTPEGACVHEEVDEAGTDGSDAEPWCPVSTARDLLMKAACQAQTGMNVKDEERQGTGPLFGRTLHSKVLELYAAALEIDSVDAEPQQHLIAMRLVTSWPDLRARDPHTLRTAKALLVARLGEAMRWVAQQQTIQPAYLELFEIARLEPSYPIRVAIAQEIGAGGDPAFAALQPRLRGPLVVEDRRVGREPDWVEKLWGGQQPDVVGEQETRQRRHGEGKVACEKREREEQRQKERRQEDEEREMEEQQWRENVMCAWLIPLLVGSVTTHRHQDTPYEFLESWVRRVGMSPDATDAAALDLSLEVALAQGFKYAANRRHRHPHARPEAREYLSEQARNMLKRTRFWFTRLTLLHTLTLWDLPDGTAGTRPSLGHGADPAEQVRQWLAHPDGEPEHPFVTAAAELCVWALETRQPERFLWIDESGVAAHVGSQTAQGEARKHNLWIPPSTGWSALHPRAQQLLADVLLLLNLAERGDWPKDRLRRVQQTDRPDLPPCLTLDRSPLDPGRTAIRTPSSEAGSNCRDGCAFELCPYPSKGLDNHRAELSETFCRHQSSLLSHSRSLLRPRAPWQHRADLAELRQFWERMGNRAQQNARPR
ncbi:NACHT domain-containing protein [Streptomyces sp. NPDC056309]|uniref:NACHT domain-containing protein n=1 Tax=unclassified Streptomyces TaxID=2593676 RepID=UPI0035DF7162